MKHAKRDTKELIISCILIICTVLTVAVTIGIIIVLFYHSFHFFKNVSFFDFLTDKEWTPSFGDKHYGILPLLSGTLLTTFIAIVIAVPMGITIAVYLNEFVGDKFRKIIKPALELLAAVPTVVYGYFALTIVTPFLRELFPSIEANNALSAGIVMAIMILPMIASLSEDALRAVPKSLRDASYGMGCTPFQTAFKVMVPSASSGIIVSVILAISRAIGETMIVTIAGGAFPNITANPLEEIQSITAYMASTSKSDVEHGSDAYYAIFAAGLALFVFSFILNIISHKIKKRYQRKYA